MRLLIQRVAGASVEINNRISANIHNGLCVFIGIEESDTQDDIQYLATKLINLRIFNDENELMNCSVLDVGGNILVVSQFTLHAQTKKGNRPSFIKAAKPELAKPLYENFINYLTQLLGKPIASGEFGANMKIALVNDGPVTIWMDSKNKE